MSDTGRGERDRETVGAGAVFISHQKQDKQPIEVKISHRKIFSGMVLNQLFGNVCVCAVPKQVCVYHGTYERKKIFKENNKDFNYVCV